MKKYLILALIVCASFFISSCSDPEGSYDEAKKNNTIAAYEKYLDEFPNSKYSSEARSILSELKFEKCKKDNTIESYKNYITEFPDAKKTNEARDSLYKLEYDKAKSENSFDNYRYYIREYPDSKYLSSIKELLDTKERTFIVPENNLSIKLPIGFNKPTVTKLNHQTIYGVVDVTYYTTENSRGAVLIMFNNLPPIAFNKSDQSLLSEQQTSILNSSNGDLIKSSKGKIDGNNGRSIYYDAYINGKLIHIRNDCFIKKPTVYQISFGAYEKNELNSNDILEYFTSITINK